MPTLAPSPHVEQADWLREVTAGLNGRVESVVPRGYPAHARLLHRADTGRGEPVTWADVATATSRTLHPLVQFTSLAQGWSGARPQWGSLDHDQLTTLSRILPDHTATPAQCWLMVWEGWGNLPSSWAQHAPKAIRPGRGYFLFPRDVRDVVDFSVEVAAVEGDSPSFAFLSPISMDSTPAPEPAMRKVPRPHLQSPSVWWPQDRAWCVGTEVDFDSTLVAGSDRLIEQITADPDLETFRVNVTDDLSAFGDTRNPQP